MRKMTAEEIRTAGRLAHDAYYNGDGYNAGKEYAEKLQAEMTLRGNTSESDIYEFERSTTYSWKR